MRSDAQPVLRVSRVANGRVEVVVTGGAGRHFDLRLGFERLDQAQAGAAGEDGTSLLTLKIPARVISDGVQVLTIGPSALEETLASVVLIAGTPYEEDLHGQVALLRAELDQLKAFIRRTLK